MKNQVTSNFWGLVDKATGELLMNESQPRLYRSRAAARTEAPATAKPTKVRVAAGWN